jgi:21S rRNA (GM2251-2'-O)-methyltransferase
MEVAASTPVPVDDMHGLGACAQQGTQAPLILALDELTDPHNVGAILRTALLTEVSAVLICDRNSAPLNGVVSKTSSGAMEWLLAGGRLLITQHLASLLSSLHESDSIPSTNTPWRVIGCSSFAAPQGMTARDGSVASKQNQQPVAVSFYDLRRNVPTVLVLGNEGKGLRKSVLSACTHTVAVPMFSSLCDIKSSMDESAGTVARLGAVDSYNVSVAAAMILGQMMHPKK